MYINENLSQKDIDVIANAEDDYSFQVALASALNKERLNALDYEPILIEMANEGTFLGQGVQLAVYEIAGLVNLHFGNLCYRAYYKEEGITKSNLEYAKTWGELLEALAERAKTADDFINLASCVQMKFAAFEDRNEASAFACMHYKNAINQLDLSLIHI